MIKHIVMWRLKDQAEGNDKATNAKLAKAKLEALTQQIDAIQHLEVGINFATGETAFDLVLYSEFDNEDKLNEYAQHPLHLDVVAFIKLIVEQRQVVDYYL